MDIKGTVALVTGANRGIGRAFVEALVERGAVKVYAGARDPKAWRILATGTEARSSPSSSTSPSRATSPRLRRRAGT